MYALPSTRDFSILYFAIQHPCFLRDFWRNAPDFIVQNRTIVSVQVANCSKIISMNHEKSDNIVAQIGEILAQAILRQRQRSEQNSVDLSGDRSVYVPRKETDT